MKNKTIECKFLPFELDQAPYGTVAKTLQDKINYFVQCGFDEINWVPMETILLKVYEDEFQDNKFIDNLLKSYSVLTK